MYQVLAMQLSRNSNPKSVYSLSILGGYLKAYPLPISCLLIVVTIYLQVSGLVYWANAITMVSIGLFVFNNFRFSFIFTFLCFLTSISLTESIQIHSREGHIANYLENEVTVRGFVSSIPYQQGRFKYALISPTSVTTLNEAETSINGGLVQIRLSRYSEIDQYQNIEFRSLLKTPERLEDFDYPLFLKTKGVFALADVHEYKLYPQESADIRVMIRDLRNYIRNQMQTNLPEPHAALAIGMLIGTREEFMLGFGNDLSRTGTTHVIAVSGFNVTMLITSVCALAGVFNRKHLLYASIILVSTFLVLVGVDNLPALRATIMGYAMLFGKLSGRRGAVSASLSLAMITMLIINPLMLYSLSLQLSFAATLGLILLEPVVKRFLPKLLGENIRSEFAVTVAATLATLPISFNSFGSIPLLSPIANVLIAWCIPIIMLLGIAAIAVSFVLPTFVVLIYIPLWSVLEYFVQVVKALSAIENGVITINDNRDTLSMMFILFLVILYLFHKFSDDKTPNGSVISNH